MKEPSQGPSRPFSPRFRAAVLTAYALLLLASSFYYLPGDQGSEGIQESRTHLRDGGRRRLVFAALAALAGKAVIGGVGRAAAGSVGRAAAGSVAKTAASKGASGLLRQSTSKSLLSPGGSGNWGPLVNKVKQGSQPQSFWKRGSRSRGQSTASDLADEWDQPTRARSNSINEGKPKKWNLPEISGGFGGPSQETLNDYFGAGGGFLDGPPAWTKAGTMGYTPSFMQQRPGEQLGIGSSQAAWAQGSRMHLGTNRAGGFTEPAGAGLGQSWSGQ